MFRALNDLKGLKIREAAMRPARPADLPRHILVIEDDVDSRETMRLVLEGVGHRVDEAGDGQTGLEKLLALQPDIALIDVGLPDLDGYELVRAARARPEGRDLYLVALTGYSQPDDRRRAAEVGFDAVLSKPVNWVSLDDILATGFKTPF